MLIYWRVNSAFSPVFALSRLRSLFEIGSNHVQRSASLDSGLREVKWGATNPEAHPFKRRCAHAGFFGWRRLSDFGREPPGAGPASGESPDGPVALTPEAENCPPCTDPPTISSRNGTSRDGEIQLIRPTVAGQALTQYPLVSQRRDRIRFECVCPGPARHASNFC